MNPEHLKVLLNTVVVKMPIQKLASFGTTVVTYNMVTRPLSQVLDTDKRTEEAVLRRGKVKAERPKIVTPQFLSRTVGFGEDAQEFMRELIRRGQADDAGILYTYSNEPLEMEIISSRPEDVAERISNRIDRESQPLEAVILGVDELWDVSLMKFIFDLTNSSGPENAADFMRSGRMKIDNGVPMDARLRIEESLRQVQHGNLDPVVLHKELESWQLFDEYQDQFFRALKGRRLTRS
ncbi:MAG: hypothetical protein HQ477_03155 [Chloroflexi bacterium]|nr:hypothetical protein [Chloroflexota bacterium]